MAHEFFMIAVMPFPWGVKASDIAHLPLWWWNGSDDRNLDPYGAVRAQQKHLRGMKRLEVKVGCLFGACVGVVCARLPHHSSQRPMNGYSQRFLCPAAV